VFTTLQIIASDILVFVPAESEVVISRFLLETEKAIDPVNPVKNLKPATRNPYPVTRNPQLAPVMRSVIILFFN
jgi:hypothetical protein